MEKSSEKSVELQVAEQLEAASKDLAKQADDWREKVRHMKRAGVGRTQSGCMAISHLEGLMAGHDAAADDLARRADAMLARAPEITSTEPTAPPLQKAPPDAPPEFPPPRWWTEGSEGRAPAPVKVESPRSS